ncbi:hypothetical protein [Bacillus atrophaeus]|uniref:hypothetical protein n=1 Tax=Bacillus atrophaeus TaxID=1452 RepID=UPI00255C0ED9|nr:hypothetical protein [Bacillus atrophaeus]MDL5143200.1 hypothetical protein [Bacillus atrophaeus]
MGDDQYAMTPPIGWTAGDSSDNKGNTFAALFNLNDVESTVSVSLNQLGSVPNYRQETYGRGKQLAEIKEEITVTKPHAAIF